MSADEFLAWERGQAVRHVFHRGEIFAMAGGSPRHARLAVRVASRLESALEGRDCGTYSSDLQLDLVGAHFVYADAVVVCGPVLLRPGTKDVVTNPKLVVEVLSKSTEAYDRGIKQAAYLALASVEHYVLVSQREPRVEVYTRQDADTFLYRAYVAGEVVALDRVGARFAVDDVYAGAFEIPGEE